MTTDHIEDVRGMVPVEYLLNGSRFKLSFQEVECSNCGHSTSEFVCRPLDQYVSELSGEWVALVNAENDKHLKSDCPRCAELSESINNRAREQAQETVNNGVYLDKLATLEAELAGLRARYLRMASEDVATIAQQAERIKELEEGNVKLCRTMGGLCEQLAAAEKVMNRCYKMLLSEPDTKGALFKAENILREALADAAIAAGKEKP